MIRFKFNHLNHSNDIISRLTEVNTIANLLEVDSEDVKQALLTRVIAAGGQVSNIFYDREPDLNLFGIDLILILKGPS